MKIIVTTGHPAADLAGIHAALTSTGLADSLPSRREGLSPGDIVQRYLRTTDFGWQPGAIRQLSPGRLWDELLADLLLANLDVRQWGWNDAGALCLLDWLAAYDPQICFVLAYNSPAQSVGRSLAGGATAEQVDSALAVWKACSAEMLAFFHRQRGRCVLVNSGAAGMRAIVRCTRNAFMLKGIGDAAAAGTAAPSALATLVAERLVEHDREAAALFHELEASADLCAEGDVPALQPAWAWTEYAGLVEALAQARDVADSERIRFVQAQAEYHQQSGKAERNLEVAQQSLSECQSRLNASLAAAAKLEQQLAESRSRAESAEKKAASISRDELAALKAKSDELAQENELLLLQLHQVQEELETYFLKYQELAGSGDAAAGAATPALVEFTLDLRHVIDGENWYYAEEDGRWAGPGTRSTLNLPALSAGRYTLQLDIVDAMAPEILAGLQVDLDGQPLSLQNDSEGYPVLLQGEFSCAGLARGAASFLGFTFDRLISPADHGSDDERSLAIRLRSVRVARLP